MTKPLFPITEFFQSACVFCRNPNTGLILAVSRKDNHELFGLPGGKLLNPKETYLKCALRELFEETGYVVKFKFANSTNFSNPVFEAFHTVSNKPGILFYCKTFLIDYDWLEKVQETTEEGKVAWVTPKKLLEGPFGKYYQSGLFENLKIEID
jgi:8-oxo-dGTP pyrophosphatase MutT (NUDIX family)